MARRALPLPGRGSPVAILAIALTIILGVGLVRAEESDPDAGPPAPLGPVAAPSAAASDGGTGEPSDDLEGPAPDAAVDRDVDRRLRQALDREYGPSYDDAAAPASPTAPSRAMEEYRAIDGNEFFAEEEEFEIKLGLRYSFLAFRADRISAIAEDDNNLGSGVDLKTMGDYDYDAIPRYNIFVDLARWLTIDVDYFYSRYKNDRVHDGEDELFEGILFREGDELKTEIELHAGDAGLGFHVVNNEWVKLGLDLGAKYYYSSVEIENEADNERAENNLEALIPYIGAHVEFRPFFGFIIYGKIKAGLMDYDDSRSRRRSEEAVEVENQERSGRDQEFVEALVGVGYTIGDTFTLAVEWYYLDLRIRREDDGRKENFELEGSGFQVSASLKF